MVQNKTFVVWRCRRSQGCWNEFCSDYHIQKQWSQRSVFNISPGAWYLVIWNVVTVTTYLSNVSEPIYYFSVRQRKTHSVSKMPGIISEIQLLSFSSHPSRSCPQYNQQHKCKYTYSLHHCKFPDFDMGWKNTRWYLKISEYSFWNMISEKALMLVESQLRSSYIIVNSFKNVQKYQIIHHIPFCKYNPWYTIAQLCCTVLCEVLFYDSEK